MRIHERMGGDVEVGHPHDLLQIRPTEKGSSYETQACLKVRDLGSNASHQGTQHRVRINVNPSRRRVAVGDEFDSNPNAARDQPR